MRTFIAPVPVKLAKPFKEMQPEFVIEEDMVGGSSQSITGLGDRVMPKQIKIWNEQGKVYVKASATSFNIFWKKDGVLFNVQSGSGNTKTGNMVQIGFFPFEWAESKKVIEGGSDKKVCFSCPHSQSKGKTCYVRKGNPLMGMKSKMKSVDSSKVPTFNSETEQIVLMICKGRPVRFGSYGEPVLLGETLTKKIAQVASHWTGYTHRWMDSSMQWAKKYFMASVENTLEMKNAILSGWRVFYVNMNKNVSFVGAKYAPEVPKEDRLVVCPASAEGGRVTSCDRCKMCAGTTGTKVAASIVINKH